MKVEFSEKLTVIVDIHCEVGTILRPNNAEDWVFTPSSIQFSMDADDLRQIANKLDQLNGNL